MAYLAFAVGIFVQISMLPANHEANALLASGLYALALLCFYHGLVVACEGRPLWVVVVPMTLLYLALRFFYTVHDFNSIYRIYVLQGYMTAIFLLTCWAIRRVLLRGSGAERFMFLSLFIYAASIMPRTLLTVGTDSLRYGYDNTPYWIATQIALSTFIVIFSLALLLAHFSRNLERAEEKAHIDPLTRLGNRSGFHARVTSLRARCSSYSLIIIDLDKFKSINDQYGHAAGDEALAAVARVIRENIRDVDEASRYGGEEFLVFLPDTTIDEAYKIAERLRRNLEQKEMHGIAANLYCTASFGVAEFSSKVSFKAAYHYVDQLMYIAKARGRNQICHAPERVVDNDAAVWPPLRQSSV